MKIEKTETKEEFIHIEIEDSKIIAVEEHQVPNTGSSPDSIFYLIKMEDKDDSNQTFTIKLNSDYYEGLNKFVGNLRKALKKYYKKHNITR